MALTNPGFKTKMGLMFGRELKNVKEKEKRRGRRRRREEEKEGNQAKRYGTLDFVWIT